MSAVENRVRVHVPSKGAKVGRLRVIDKYSIISPTIMKSQNRMAKDSVVSRLKTGDIYFLIMQC